MRFWDAITSAHVMSEVQVADRRDDDEKSEPPVIDEADSFQYGAVAIPE